MSRRSLKREEYRQIGRHEADLNVPGLVGDLDSEQALVRSHAARVLGRSGARLAASHIAALADDPAKVVRMTAFHALGALEACEFEGLLVAGLNDPEPVVRMSAASAIGRTAGPEAIPSLRNALDTDPDRYVRLHAIEALVLLGDTQSRDRVPDVLKAISWRVRGHPRWKRLREGSWRWANR